MIIITQTKLMEIYKLTTNVNIALNICYHIRNWSLCSFDFRRKRAIQRRSSSTSFTEHIENSPTRKLTMTSLSTETKLKSKICFFCNQKGHTSEEKQPKDFTLHRVTTLNRRNDQVVRCWDGRHQLNSKTTRGWHDF